MVNVSQEENEMQNQSASVPVVDSSVNDAKYVSNMHKVVNYTFFNISSENFWDYNHMGWYFCLKGLGSFIFK